MALIGPEGLLNLSSKPHSCSHATPEAIENAILALRGKSFMGSEKAQSEARAVRFERGVGRGQYLR
jgi:hypothetical protein